MSEHFNTTRGWPQAKADVLALNDSELYEFMSMCDVEPADFDDCLSCYAYKVTQDRELERKPRQWITEYRVSALPEGLVRDGYAWDIVVAWRGDGLWAVTHHTQCLSASGKWDYEPLPSSRTDAWLVKHRFTEQEALRRAREIAPTLTINGMTPADLIAKHSATE